MYCTRYVPRVTISHSVFKAMACFRKYINCIDVIVPIHKEYNIWFDCHHYGVTHVYMGLLMSIVLKRHPATKLLNTHFIIRHYGVAYRDVD
jgi:hypothetical protein